MTKKHETPKPCKPSPNWKSRVKSNSSALRANHTQSTLEADYDVKAAMSAVR